MLKFVSALTDNFNCLLANKPKHKLYLDVLSAYQSGRKQVKETILNIISADL